MFKGEDRAPTAEPELEEGEGENTRVCLWWGWGGERGKGLPAEHLEEGGVAGCSRLRKMLASQRRKLPDIPQAMQSFVEITVCEDGEYNHTSWQLRWTGGKDHCVCQNREVERLESWGWVIHVNVRVAKSDRSRGREKGSEPSAEAASE